MFKAVFWTSYLKEMVYITDKHKSAFALANNRLRSFVVKGMWLSNVILKKKPRDRKVFITT